MTENCTIIAIARNEGLFLVEWVAHHLALGFDHIVIATNDCEDGSDELLNAISSHFPVSYIDNSGASKNLTVQQRGNRLCLEHSVVQESDWVLHIDIDEFLNIRSETGEIKPFLKQHRDADAIALLWKIFGDNGRLHWDGGFVTDAFWSCEANIPFGQGHKTIFRPDVFQGLTPHMPKAPRKPANELNVVNSCGEKLPVDRHYLKRGSAYQLDQELLTWENAYINHYMIKSHDLSRMKLLRGDANGRAVAKRKPGTPEFEYYNRNDVSDVTIQETRNLRLEVYHMMMAVPEIARLHLGCFKWFINMREVRSL